MIPDRDLPRRHELRRCAISRSRFRRHAAGLELGAYMLRAWFERPDNPGPVWWRKPESHGLFRRRPA